MSMTADLRDHWKAVPIAGGRVYRDERPQGTVLPAVWFQVITGARDALMKGEHALNPTRLQVNCLGDSRGAADELAEAVLGARPLRAAVGDTHFSRLIVDNIGEDSERQETGGTIFRTRIDLIVWHRPLT
jgi:hypothetical protein